MEGREGKGKDTPSFANTINRSPTQPAMHVLQL